MLNIVCLVVSLIECGWKCELKTLPFVSNKMANHKQRNKDLKIPEIYTSLFLFSYFSWSLNSIKYSAIAAAMFYTEVAMGFSRNAWLWLDWKLCHSRMGEQHQPFTILWFGSYAYTQYVILGPVYWGVVYHKRHQFSQTPLG